MGCGDGGGGGGAKPYGVPSQFKPLNQPPALDEASSPLTELWLVRISDPQLGAEDLKSQRLAMHLHSPDGRLCQFQTPKGILYDLVASKQLDAAQPFAFLPIPGATALDARKISRQVSIIRSLDLEAESMNPASEKRKFLEEKNGIILNPSGDELPGPKRINSTRENADFDPPTIERTPKEKIVQAKELDQVLGKNKQIEKGKKVKTSHKRPIRQERSSESDTEWSHKT